jgi:hypothetical protein
LAKGLLEVRRDRFKLRRGAREAVPILAPLVVGYALGLVEASVLVTLGPLNLVFIESPGSGPTPWRTPRLATRAVNHTVYAVWVTLTVIVLLNLAYSGGRRSPSPE